MCIDTQMNKNYENDPVVYRINDPAGATFEIADPKLYAPVVN